MTADSTTCAVASESLDTTGASCIASAAGWGAALASRLAGVGERCRSCNDQSVERWHDWRRFILWTASPNRPHGQPQQLVTGCPAQRLCKRWRACMVPWTRQRGMGVRTRCQRSRSPLQLCDEHMQQGGHAQQVAARQTGQITLDRRPLLADSLAEGVGGVPRQGGCSCQKGDCLSFESWVTGVGSRVGVGQHRSTEKREEGFHRDQALAWDQVLSLKVSGSSVSLASDGVSSKRCVEAWRRWPVGVWGS